MSREFTPANSILEYLEQTAVLYPDAPAYCSDTEQTDWHTVREQARRIGAALLQMRPFSANPQTDALPLAALLMDKAPRTAITMLGCAYAGYAYVVLDTSLLSGGSDHRMRELLDFLHPEFLLYDDSRIEAAHSIEQLHTVHYQELLSLCPDLTENDITALNTIQTHATPEDTLCLTFTSSSSGHPKCVETSHLAVIRYIEGLADILQADQTTIFGNQAPFCFDACMKELFVSLKCGSSAWLIPNHLFGRPTELIKYLNDHRINTICWVSSAYALPAATDCFADIRPDHLRTAAFGSEIMPPDILAYWMTGLPETRFINLYGPTEATGMSTWFPVPTDFRPEDYPIIPIGRPFPGVEVLLLGENDAPATEGETGELILRSNRLAKGYYQMKELTDQVFSTEPTLSHDRDLTSYAASPYNLYRTGDLAKYLPAGDLVFLGRKDSQVKRMGYRIDLSELERLAVRCSGVGGSCCIQTEDGRILLYLTASSTNFDTDSIDPVTLVSSVSAALRQQLPAYAQPNQIRVLEEFPHLPGGKIDRIRLRTHLF